MLQKVPNVGRGRRGGDEGGMRGWGVRGRVRGMGGGGTEGGGSCTCMH